MCPLTKLKISLKIKNKSFRPRTFPFPVAVFWMCVWLGLMTFYCYLNKKLLNELLVIQPCENQSIKHLGKFCRKLQHNLENTQLKIAWSAVLWFRSSLSRNAESWSHSWRWRNSDGFGQDLTPPGRLLWVCFIWDQTQFTEIRVAVALLMGLTVQVGSF